MNALRESARLGYATRRTSRPAARSLVAGLLLVAVLVVTVVSSIARISAPVAPQAPVALEQGDRVPRTAWSLWNRSALTVSFEARSGSSPAIPEVEVSERSASFIGAALAHGAPIGARQDERVRVTLNGLRDGIAYRWRARLRGEDGRSSRWVAFGSPERSAPAFVVDLAPPPAPRLWSPTDPNPTVWYQAATATLIWAPPLDKSGIAGYALALDRNPVGSAPLRLTLRLPRAALTVGASGTWFVHVRALDGAGNWGPAATYPLHINLRPLAVTAVAFPHIAFDPDAESEAMVMTMTVPAALHAEIIRQSDAQVVRTLDLPPSHPVVTLLWDGRDAQGVIQPEGTYRFLVTATDRLGGQAVADYSDLVLLRRRVVVSLHAQRLTAYEGTRAVATTLVTTGNKALPTPLGLFHVIVKVHPYTFHSPWPPGSPFYYSPSTIQYGLLFDWGGFFIHDASWRTVFGPGSNAHIGRPGQDYTGTHGCVNVPADIAAWLYGWAPVGTTVAIVP